MIEIHTIKRTIKIPFIFNKNIKNFILDYLKINMERKTIEEGYIIPNTCKITYIHIGRLMDEYIIYDYHFECEIFSVKENENCKVIVSSITLIGIRAILQEEDNPLMVFISKDLIKNIEDYSINQIIDINVLAFRFQLNDPFISVIGEII